MRAAGTQDPSKTTRRRFIKSLAAIQAVPSAISSLTAPAQQLEVKPSALAEALGRIVELRYGRYLTPDQLEQVKKDIERGLQAAGRLRAVKLKNSDEPDFIFSASIAKG